MKHINIITRLFDVVFTALSITLIVLVKNDDHRMLIIGLAIVYIVHYMTLASHFKGVTKDETKD